MPCESKLYTPVQLDFQSDKEGLPKFSPSKNDTTSAEKIRRPQNLHTEQENPEMTSVWNLPAKPAHPDRIAKVKAAWMERYNKTEADWDTFKPATEPVESVSKSPKDGPDGYVWDDRNSIHFEYPLCPTYEEMSLRAKKKADYFLYKASKTSGPERDAFLKDAEFWNNLAVDMNDRSIDINKKGR